MGSPFRPQPRRHVDREAGRSQRSTDRSFAGAIGAVLWSNRPPVRSTGRRSSPLHAIPLTTYQGREQQPAFAPDGNAVAFSGNGEAEDNWDVYVKQIGSRITTTHH